MKHRLQISVSREPPGGMGPPRMELMRCRRVSVRERFLRLIFGEKRRVTVIVPGDTVETVSIEELPEAETPATQGGGVINGRG